METRHLSPTGPTESPRPGAHRQRSNSFPIVEALGCSTPEAQLILAEGRAAVRKRRARRRQSRSVNDTNITTFHPKDHIHHLQDAAVGTGWPVAEPILSDARSCHARIPSNTTDCSTSTIVPQLVDCKAHSSPSAISPLGNYSANLAQFIKAQLKSIPTYQPALDHVAPSSPRSCPDFSFPMHTPPLSPNLSSTMSMRRPTEVPKSIVIPPIRPPMKSTFSAWSSTDDDETDGETPSLPDLEPYTKDVVHKPGNYTPSVLGYYETSNNASFLFSSTPDGDESEPHTATGSIFPGQSASPGLGYDEPHDEDDYPSSSLSRPQLSTSSAPSYISSAASVSSYFDCKRPLAVAPELKHRIIAALTPPQPHAKIISAISPWEGGAIANVHDVFVESQQRVHVDGMSFDMLRDFIVPSRITTPC